MAREFGQTKVVIPVWYNVTEDDVRKYSPSLADKLSIYYDGSVKRAASKLLRAVHKESQQEGGWTPVYLRGRSGLDFALLPIRPVRGMALGVARFPVTNEQYLSFVKATGHPSPLGQTFVDGEWKGPFAPWDDDQFSLGAKPVVCVDFWDCIEFCRWVSSEKERIFLPPSELWDFVASAGQFGHNPRIVLRSMDSSKLHHRASSPIAIAEDGARDNQFGVSDAFGNVWEWCDQNIFEEQYSPDALGASQRRYVAELRGGGFLDDLGVIHPEVRSDLLPYELETKHSDLGFRVCAAFPTESINAGIAAVLATMPGLPESVWMVPLYAAGLFREGSHYERRRRFYEGKVLEREN